MSEQLHWSASHPLAVVAASLCSEHGMPLVGGVACGACWERAIRDDERFAVVNGLPRELVADPALIDEVAVARAVRGEHVALTPSEVEVTVALLHARGQGPHTIAKALGISLRRVYGHLRHNSALAQDDGANEAVSA